MAWSGSATTTATTMRRRMPEILRRCRLQVAALYAEEGEYTYSRGISWVAVIALLAGALPSLPGFLVNVEALEASSVAPWLLELYSYAWFVGFGTAFILYLILRRMTRA